MPFQPSPPNARPSALKRPPPARTRALAVLLFFAVAGLWLHGPIPQWPGYHAFADTQGFRGLPNAMNVLSNLPFVVVGLAGIAGLLRLPQARQAGAPGSAGPGHAAWMAFAAAIACTAFGSAHCHWAPDNASLVWDRLPIAWACAALSCALLAERVDRRFGNLWNVAAAMLAGTASVGLWWCTVAPNGPLEGGDLRAYLFVQFLPMLLIPFLMTRPAPHPRVLSPGAAWAALGLYACAKVLEASDHAVMHALHLVGGHPFKHLLAAAGAAVLLWDVAACRPIRTRR